MEGRDPCMPGQVQDGGLCEAPGLETGRERELGTGGWPLRGMQGGGTWVAGLSLLVPSHLPSLW